MKNSLVVQTACTFHVGLYTVQVPRRGVPVVFIKLGKVGSTLKSVTLLFFKKIHECLKNYYPFAVPSKDTHTDIQPKYEVLDLFGEMIISDHQ